MKVNLESALDIKNKGIDRTVNHVYAAVLT